MDAAVSYYGVGIENLLGEADHLGHPLLMHIARNDQFVPPEAQAQIVARLAGHPNAIVHLYADRDHAFARPGGEHYDAADAAKANERTLAFLKMKIG